MPVGRRGVQITRRSNFTISALYAVALGGNPVIIGDWVKQVATSYSSISLYSLLLLIAVDQLAALLHMRRVWPLRTPRNSRTYQPAIKSVKYCIAGVKILFLKHRHHSGWEIFLLPWMLNWIRHSYNMPINQVQNLQKQLAQLKEEAKVNRIPVSEAVKE